MEVYNSKGSSQGFIRGMIYGEGGAGKTTFLTTIPGIVILNTEDKDLESISHLDVPVLDVKSRLDFLEALKIISEPKKFQEMVNSHDNFKDYKVSAIGVDSITALKRILINDVVGPVRELPDRKNNDWQKISARQMKLVSLSLQVPYDLWFTARVYYQQDEISGRLLGYPNCVGELRSDFSGLVNELYYIESKEGPAGSGRAKRIIHTQTYSLYVAKSEMKNESGDSLAAELSPDWGEILAWKSQSPTSCVSAIPIL